MSLASDLLPTLASARSIAGSLGLRPYRVFATTRSSSGAYTGSGTIADSEIELLEGSEPPRVKFATDEQIALGSMTAGDATIGPVTPTATAGGVDLSTLKPNVDSQESFYLRLLGPDSRSTFFRITEVNTEGALRFTIRARAVAGVE